LVTLDLIREAVGSVSWSLGSGNSSYNPHTLTKAFTIKGIDGTDVPKIAYSSTAASDPTYQPSVLVGAFASDNLTTGLTLVYDIIVLYDCTFWQRRSFAV
jgi:hypothetical protein